MNLTFDSWTDYDNWLVENYINYNIYKVNEVNSKIEIEYCEKGKLAEVLAENNANEKPSSNGAVESEKNDNPAAQA